MSPAATTVLLELGLSLSLVLSIALILCAVWG